MNTVLLVIDPQFTALSQLPLRTHPLWIIDSEFNRKEMKKLTISGASVTWFSRWTGENVEQLFGRITESLDQHHNMYAQKFPYSILDVYGLPKDAEVINWISDIGFVSKEGQHDFIRFRK